MFEARDAEKREVVIRSQLRSQPTISWVAFGWPDGTFFAGHKLGNGVIEMIEIAGDRKGEDQPLRVRQAAISLLKSSRVEDTNYSVTDQEWFREVVASNDENWSTLTTHPNGERLAAAFAAPIQIDQKPAGVIAIIIELTRVSNFLSQLTVGKSAGAFILDREGGVVAAPDPDASEVTPLKTDHPLFPVAVDAMQQCRQRLQSRRGRAAEAPGDAGRQGLSGGADADLVSGLVAGDSGAGVGISRARCR